MERGQEFGRYTSFKSERVLLYYKPDNSSSSLSDASSSTPTSTTPTGGWLYWSDNLKKDDRPQNRISLSESKTPLSMSSSSRPLAHAAHALLPISLYPRVICIYLNNNSK
jgi:hypothetical protein